MNVGIIAPKSQKPQADEEINVELELQLEAHDDKDIIEFPSNTLRWNDIFGVLE